MTRAPFLSLDGIDGTGKSTQCRLLVEWLNTSDIPAVACADPGGTPLGDQLRQILLASRADISDRAEALLFMASRAELVARVVHPALESGQVVVSDRFVAANVCYQGHGRGLPPEELWSVGEFATGGLMPDMTVILDLPVEQAVARRGRAADRMERRGEQFLERVRQGFLSEARSRPGRWFVIDASPDEESVQLALRAFVGSYLGARGIKIRAIE